MQFNQNFFWTKISPCVTLILLGAWQLSWKCFRYSISLADHLISELNDEHLESLWQWKIVRCRAYWEERPRRLRIYLSYSYVTSVNVCRRRRRTSNAKRLEPHYFSILVLTADMAASIIGLSFFSCRLTANLRSISNVSSFFPGAHHFVSNGGTYTSVLGNYTQIFSEENSEFSNGFYRYYLADCPREAKGNYWWLTRSKAPDDYEK